MSIAAKPKKRGRPATGKDPMVGLRLSPELTRAVDSWAEERNLTRSEAIRTMIERALSSHDMANRRKRR